MFRKFYVKLQTSELVSSRVNSPQENKNNTLAQRFPEIAREYDPIKNKGRGASNSISCNSTTNYYWICKKGHSFEASVARRIKCVETNIIACPHCRRMMDPSLLSVSHPDIAKGWDHVRNRGNGKNVPITSTVRYYWVCDNGHSFREAPLSLVEKKLSGIESCPFCRDEDVIKPAKPESLSILYPDIASEWDYAKNKSLPGYVCWNSKRHYYWLCEHGHSYTATPLDRIEDMKNCRKSCPQCKKHTDPKYLKVSYPEIAKEWDESNNIKGIVDITCKNAKGCYWLCSEGHSYKASPLSRIKLFELNIEACPKCRNKNVRIVTRKPKSNSIVTRMPKSNSIAIMYPELLSEWDYERNNMTCAPEQTSSTSKKAFRWICKNGHTYWQSPYDRVEHHKNGTESCPHCKKKISSQSYCTEEKGYKG